jgi:signal transduction histidine kinase
LEVHAGDGVRTVLGDPDALFQALRNVFENACQHARRGSTVRLIAERVSYGVELSVENEGDEIPPEDLPHVFERFYRADRARARVRGGTGIGLAVVKELIEAHGGRVGAESSAGRTRISMLVPAPEPPR